MSLLNDMEATLVSLAAKHRLRELSHYLKASFVHNDYLGLSEHPHVIEAGIKALKEQGAGSRGSRLLGGNSKAFENAEEKIAEFFGAPAALWFSTGYLANLGLVRALGERADRIYSDEKNHASLIDAISLTKNQKTIVPHFAWDSAERITSKSLLVTETLFSMDGDILEWGKLKPIADKTGAFVVLDEAHAAGIFPLDGRGFHSLPTITGPSPLPTNLPHHTNEVAANPPPRAGDSAASLPPHPSFMARHEVPKRDADWERLAVVITFGKAFGCAGACVLGSEKLKRFLINTARSFIYSTAPPPAIPEMVVAATQVIQQSPQLRQELWRRASWVRERFRGLQGTQNPPLPQEKSEWEKRSPIIPFLIPGDDSALLFAQNMRHSGFELRAIRYPTVAPGSERLRITIHLGVSWEQTRAMAEEAVKQWKAFSSSE